MSRREPPGPDEPDYNESEWGGFALNVGLNLAATFGLGLSLFNALRRRFEGVSASILGSIASTIGQAVRTATGLTTDELKIPPVLDDLPIVPASWHPGEPGDRVLAGVDIETVSRGASEPTTKRFWVNGLEIMTPQDLLDEAQRLADQAKDTSPKKIGRILAQAQQLVFLAKRY